MAEANRDFVLKKLQEWGFGDFIDNFHRKCQNMLSSFGVLNITKFCYTIVIAYLKYCR